MFHLLNVTKFHCGTFCVVRSVMILLASTQLGLNRTVFFLFTLLRIADLF